MPSVRLEDLSSFGRAALALDREFSALADVGAQMSRAEIASDKGLDEALKILNRAAQHGESLAAAMQKFSSSLQEARDKAEASASNFKRVERQADSMIDSLQASLRKIASAIAPN